LKGTCDEKLTFRKANKDLIGLVDANWAGDSNDRRSCSGFVFILAGGTVVLSSTESEYIALSEGARESVYLTHLLSELTGKNQCSCTQSIRVPLNCAIIWCFTAGPNTLLSDIIILESW
jgi:hypothetical protein